jgi:hypothetical protein
MPQVPQFLASVLVSVHAPEQAVCPLMAQPQAPLLQVWPVLHDVVQLPQCALSVFVSTQLPLQFVWGDEQEALAPPLPGFVPLPPTVAPLPPTVAPLPPCARPDPELLAGWLQSMMAKPIEARITPDTIGLVMRSASEAS